MPAVGPDPGSTITTLCDTGNRPTPALHGRTVYWSSWSVRQSSGDLSSRHRTTFAPWRIRPSDA
jgi:hypothetical protein